MSTESPPVPTASAKQKTTPEVLTGSGAILRSLEKLGITDVFGLPGGAIMPFYDELMSSTTIRHILVRHEQGAGHAAEGYASSSGKVGVAIATSGPGATNLVTAIADAHMDSVPMIAITGQVFSTSMGTDAFQEVDIVGITMPITKHSFLVTRPKTSRRPSRRRTTSPPPAVPARCSSTSPRTASRLGAVHLAAEGRPARLPADIKAHGKQINAAAKLLASPAAQCSTWAAA